MLSNAFENTWSLLPMTVILRVYTGAYVSNCRKTPATETRVFANDTSNGNRKSGTHAGCQHYCERVCSFQITEYVNARPPSLIKFEECCTQLGSGEGAFMVLRTTASAAGRVSRIQTSTRHWRAIRFRIEIGRLQTPSQRSLLNDWRDQAGQLCKPKSRAPPKH